MPREIKLLPPIGKPKYYQVPFEQQAAEALLRPEEYAEQMRVLLAALDETNAALRTFGFQVGVNIQWGVEANATLPSSATIQKTVKL